jgi:putative transposase
MRYDMAYRFRFYPTEAQREARAKTFGCARYVYNWALALRTDRYYYEEGTSVSYTDTSTDTSKALTALKRAEAARSQDSCANS